MTKHRKAAMIALVAGAISLMLFLSPILRIHSGPSLAEVNAKISQKLPIGADKVEVIGFLDDNAIERSEYLEKERVVFGIVRDVCYGIVLECSIDMKFRFDEHGKLVTYSVEEGLTGL